MKVILVNGSSHKNGTTMAALDEMIKVFDASGVETEVIQLGAKPIADCLQCNSCAKTGKCVFDDGVNDFVEKAKSADGFVFAAPVYFAHPSGRIFDFFDRAFCSSGKNELYPAFMFKPGATVAVARRGGTTASPDALNQLPSSSKTFGEKVGGIVDSVASLTGLPVKNIRRDVLGIVHTIESSYTQTTKKSTPMSVVSLGKALYQGLRSAQWKLIQSALPDPENKQDEIYAAYMSGDANRIKRATAAYTSDTAAQTAIKKALRENDERIRAAAEARIAGDTETYREYVEEIYAEGHFDKNTIVMAISGEMSSIESEQEAAVQGPEEPSSTTAYKAKDFAAAVNIGDTETMQAVRDELTAAYGEEDAEKKLTSAVNTYYKELYQKAYVNKDDEEMKRIRECMLSSGCYKGGSAITEKCKSWIQDLSKTK